MKTIRVASIGTFCRSPSRQQQSQQNVAESVLPQNPDSDYNPRPLVVFQILSRAPNGFQARRLERFDHDVCSYW